MTAHTSFPRHTLASPSPAATASAPGFHVVNEPRPMGPATDRAETQQALRLLAFEGQLRRAQTRAEFYALLANGLRTLTRGRQIFVFARQKVDDLQIVAITQIATVDRTAPLIAAFERLIALHARAPSTGSKQIAQVTSLSLSSLDQGRAFAEYPFQSALWMPWIDRTGRATGGALLTRTEPWTDGDVALIHRIGLAASQALHWIDGRNSPMRAALAGNWQTRASVAAAIGVVALLPITSSTLAPCEIVPRASYVVAAPMDGVIETVGPAPNGAVVKGDLVVRLAAGSLEGKLAVADREVDVAASRVKKASALAVVDARGRQELALARAEHAVKLAERAQARELLQRSRIRAGADGIAIYADRRELIGKPVVTGERILEIADPQSVEVRIDVNVADAVFLNDVQRIKIYLDNQPLSALEASLVRSDYQARALDNGAMAFRAVAELTSDPAPPRLGLRGTAQLFAHSVPLAYYLLRRPMAAARQWLGW